MLRILRDGQRLGRRLILLHGRLLNLVLQLFKDLLVGASVSSRRSINKRHDGREVHELLDGQHEARIVIVDLLHVRLRPLIITQHIKQVLGLLLAGTLAHEQREAPHGEQADAFGWVLAFLALLSLTAAAVVVNAELLVHEYQPRQPAALVEVFAA